MILVKRKKRNDFDNYFIYIDKSSIYIIKFSLCYIKFINTIKLMSLNDLVASYASRGDTRLNYNATVKD
jgi:hypothetical protein